MSDAVYINTSKYAPEAGAPAPAGGAWGRVMVAASACVLTVSIVGSAAFLGFRIHERRQLRERVQGFIAALENRTDVELAERAEQLREKPKAAEYVLPEIRRALRASRSENQLCAVVKLCGAFVDRREIETAIFDLRGDRREVVAAAAVEALAKVQPSERAADLLGQCLVGGQSGETVPAGVDSACAGLFGLGAAGRAEIEKRVGTLSIDRRKWLVKYVNEVGGPYRESWLNLLSADLEESVRASARQALIPIVPQATSATITPGSPPGKGHEQISGELDPPESDDN